MGREAVLPAALFPKTRPATKSLLSPRLSAGGSVHCLCTLSLVPEWPSS